MIKKENRPLSRCKISFPLLPEHSFMGVFEIHEDITNLWIEFDKSDGICSDLSLFFKNNDNFTALILDGNELGYSCFGCFALDDCNVPHLDFGLIKLFCNRWIEALHIDSEEIPFAKKSLS